METIFVSQTFNIQNKITMLSDRLSTDRVAQINDTTLHLNGMLNSIIYNNKKYTKQVAVLERSRVLINNTKQQNQTNFCLL